MLNIEFYKNHIETLDTDKGRFMCMIHDLYMRDTGREKCAEGGCTHCNKEKLLWLGEEFKPNWSIVKPGTLIYRSDGMKIGTLGTVYKDKLIVELDLGEEETNARVICISSDECYPDPEEYCKL